MTPSHLFFIYSKIYRPRQSRSPIKPMMVDLGNLPNMVGMMVLHVGVHRIDGHSTNDTPRPSLLEAQKGALGNEKMLCWLQNWMYILDSKRYSIDRGFIFSRWSWNRFPHIKFGNCNPQVFGALSLSLSSSLFLSIHVDG